jgi:hypothetical protein
LRQFTSLGASVRQNAAPNHQRTEMRRESESGGFLVEKDDDTRRVRRCSVSVEFSIPRTRSHDYDKESTSASSAPGAREMEDDDLVLGRE